MDPQTKSRRIFILGVAVLFGLLFFIWFFLFGPGKRANIEIFVAPSDSKVTMDGKPIKAGKVSVKPGKHKFAATREHFSSVEKEADTATLGGTKTIYLGLPPADAEGKAYLASHPEEQARYERISGADFSTTQDKIHSEYPVIEKLPYQTVDYKIDYDVTQDKNVEFLIKFYPPNAVTPGSDLYKQYLLRLKDEALNYLRDQHVDTSKATIKYDPDISSL